MAEIIVSARGQIDRLNQWEKDLNSKFLKFTYGHIHGEISDAFQKKHPELIVEENDLVGMWQLGVRPIRFYQLVFPEPMTEKVLGMINPARPWNKKLDKLMYPVRKILGLESIPDFKPQIKEELKDPGEYLNRDNIECIGYGYKKDRYENGIEQL